MPDSAHSAMRKGSDSASASLPAGVTEPALRAQLERILASDCFSLSDRLSRFLRFVVEHVLDGNPGSLKEYVIGIEVFDKDESFDPRVDSIVRVEASRLRTKLREYYAEEGRADSIRIQLAKRGYAPEFSCRPPDTDDRDANGARTPPESTSVPAPSSRRRSAARWHGPAAGIAIVVLAAGVHLWTGGQSRESEPRLRDPPDARLAPPKHSVAVLPLKNLSGQPSEEYFSDAMTDALITSIAKLDAMQVTSMTSVMHYKGVDKPVPVIARELNVGHVVEGSVVRHEERVRITAQLIEGETDTHLWAESYEHAATDILSLQRDVAERVAAALAGEILPVDTTSPTREPAVIPTAHEAYLKGRYFRNQLSENGLRKGVEYFESAIEKQPDYAPAYAGMASCYCLLGGHGLEILPPAESMPRAKAAALKALEIDGTLAEPHAVLGIIRTKYDWDWEGAEKDLRHALELNPSFAQGHVWYSIYLEAMKRHDEAVAEARLAREIDPLSLAANVNLGWQLYQAGRDGEAAEQYAGTLELDAGFWGTHWALGFLYLGHGRHAKAIAALEEAVERGGGHTLALSTLAHAHAVSGDRAAALAILKRLTTSSPDTYVSPAHVATVYAGLGERDRVFEWLEKAYVARSRSLAWLNVAREWDGVRSDPRFADLLKRVGLKG